MRRQNNLGKGVKYFLSWLLRPVLHRTTREQMFQIGISDIISKPIDPERLLAVIIEQTGIKKTDGKDSHPSNKY